MSKTKNSPDKRCLLMPQEIMLFIPRLSPEQTSRLVNDAVERCSNFSSPDYSAPDYSDEPILGALWELWSMRIDEDREKYIEVCERNRRNGAMKHARRDEPAPSEAQPEITPEAAAEEFSAAGCRPQPTAANNNPNNNYNPIPITNTNNNSKSKSNSLLLSPPRGFPARDELTAFIRKNKKTPVPGCLIGDPEAEADAYISYNRSLGWKSSDGRPVKNWQAACLAWLSNPAHMPQYFTPGPLGLRVLPG